MYILKHTNRVIAHPRRHHYSSIARHHLLHLPLELLLRIAEYLSFADLWYLATCSRYCKTLAHQIIWHRYHIDLSKPQLHAYNHLVYSALAHISRHGYHQHTIDHTVIQSVANRLAVEIDDKSPLKNWEHCLDFFLDKTLGMMIDHIMLEPLLDIVPKHTLYKPYHRELLTEFYPTRMGHLMTTFLASFRSTVLALFETEPSTEIYHRLLINHINRQLDILASQYQNHHHQRCLVSTSASRSTSHHHKAIEQQTTHLRLQLRVLIRFIGSLVQTDLLSPKDLYIITRQRIQYFFVADEPPMKKRRKNMYESLRHGRFEEVEFQMEIFSDLTRAVLLLENSSDVVSVLDKTVNTLVHQL